MTNRTQKKKRIEGQKKPFTRKEIGLIQELLKIKDDKRSLALFTLGIDSMLRASDLVNLEVETITDHEGKVKNKFSVIQIKTGQPVEITLTQKTIDYVQDWLNSESIYYGYVFKGATIDSHLSIERYRVGIKNWVKSIGLNPREYSTHSVRRTKPSIVYKETGNIEEVKRMLGHTTLAMTSEYLGIDKEKVSDLATRINVL